MQYCNVVKRGSFTAISRIVAATVVAALTAAALAGGATPCEFDGRTGPIEFTNRSLYPVRVRVVHADTNKYYPNESHYWEVKGGETLRIAPEAGFGYGSDWGIRVGSSKVRCVGNAGGWDATRSTFIVSTDTFHF